MRRNLNYAHVFEGDARFTVVPIGWAASLPRAVQVPRYTAKLLAQNFEDHGHSTHTTDGRTLWVTLAYCEWKGYRYLLKFVSDLGWYVKKLNEGEYE